MQTILRLVLVFAVASLAVPSIARGDLRQFLPSIYSTEAEIDINASRETFKNTSGGSVGINTADNFFSERFVYSTNGWIYHPRFIIFLAKLGLGLNEENFSGESPVPGSEGGWSTSFVTEYEFRARILPEHPYNLEVYTLRQNPFIQGRISGGFTAVGYDSGAIFRYKKRPFGFDLGYNMTTLESPQSTTNANNVRTNATYFKDWVSLSGSFSHTSSDSSSFGVSTSYSSDNYSFENQLKYPKREIYLTSGVNGVIYNQNSIVQTFDDRTLTWTEQLSAELPLNLTSNVFYTHFDDNGKTLESGASSETPQSSKSDNTSFSLTHKLYRSLITTYSFSYQSTTSAEGDSTASTKGTNQSLNSTYTKKIPGGLLVAGVVFSRATTDVSGALAVINEPQTAQIFGDFTLQQSNVDDASITVRVKAPDTGILVDLTRNIHYLVFQVGNTTRIQIIAIPAEALSPDPLFRYNFLITYSLIPEQVKLQTNTFGYSVRLELFNNLVSPYYTYNHSEQTVLSGTLAGVPEVDTSNTAGILFQKEPYSLLLEYQSFQSTVNPYKQYRAEANYKKDVTPTAHLIVRALYRRTSYGQDLLQTNIPFTETSVGMDAHLQKSFYERRLETSLGGSFSYTSGLSKANSYYLDALLIWKMGLIELKAGAQVGQSQIEIEGSIGKQESLHQYYYLSIVRKLL